MPRGDAALQQFAMAPHTPKDVSRALLGLRGKPRQQQEEVLHQLRLGWMVDYL